MKITKLQQQGFRNLKTCSIALHPKFNVFFGANGSGKTSIVEAIYFLGMGRSFRTPLLNRIIAHDGTGFHLFAEIADGKRAVPIGVLRDRQGASELRLDGKKNASAVDVAQLLPILLFNPEIFSLLNVGSKGRRQLLDWGVFYVASDFVHAWTQTRRVIKQRNMALKTHQQLEALAAWDQLLCEQAEIMQQARETYVKELCAMLTGIIGDFLDQHHIQLSLYHGWPKSKTLAECLVQSKAQDLKQGFTHYGPHRADLRFRVGQTPAQDILSRGQQKLLICAVKVAQALLYQKATQKSPIILIDDLTSELDAKYRHQLMACLQKLKAVQILLTCIDPSVIAAELPVDKALFEVSAGTICPLTEDASSLESSYAADCVATNSS